MNLEFDSDIETEPKKAHVEFLKFMSSGGPEIQKWLFTKSRENDTTH